MENIKEVISRLILDPKGAYILFVLCLVQIVWFWVKRGAQVYEDMRGEDKKWEAPEVITVMALIVWTPMIIGNLFFNLTLSPEWITSLTYVMSLGIGSRVALDITSIVKGGDKGGDSKPPAMNP